MMMEAGRSERTYTDSLHCAKTILGKVEGFLQRAVGESPEGSRYLGSTGVVRRDQKVVFPDVESAHDGRNNAAEHSQPLVL